MRFIVTFLLLGVALASEVAIDEDTLRIKVASDQLRQMLDQYIQLKEMEMQRSWIDDVVSAIKQTVNEVGNVVSGVTNEVASSFNKIEEEISKIQGAAVNGIITGIEKLYPEIGNHAGVIGKEFEKIFVEIRKNCDCQETVCQCCSTAIPSQKICFEFKIDKENLAVGAGLSWNDKVVKKEFSIKNPVPLCLAMPGAPIISTCITPKDLKLEDNTFTGCFRVGLSIKVLGEILSQEITCAKGSRNGFRFTPPRSREITINLPGLKTKI